MLAGRRAFERPDDFDIVPHLLQMCAHGLARLLRIAPLHRFQNSLVMNLAALRTALDAENPHALLAQKSTMESSSERISGLAAAFRQRQMKIKIGFDVGLRIFLRSAVHHRDRLAHGRQFRLLDARRSQCGNLRLENGAHFGQMRGAFLLPDLHHQIERLPRRLRGAIRDKCAAPGVGFD